MRTKWKTTTAITLVLSVASGGPAFPQEGLAPVCGEGVEPPCVTADGELRAADAPAEAPAEAAPADEAPPKAQAGDTAQPADAPAEAAQDAPAIDEAPAEAAEAAAPEQPATEEAAEPPEQGDVVDSTAAPADSLESPPPVLDESPAAGDEAQASSDPEVADETRTVGTPAEEPTPDAAEAPTVTPDAVTDSTAEPGGPEPEATPSDALQATPETAPAEATATGNQDTGSETATPEPPVATTDEPAATGDVGEVVAPPEAAAATAAATSPLEGTAASAGNVVVEEAQITEETSRSSNEEFATSVGQNAQPDAGSDRDKGLSNFEKALLLGLGAAVVGSLLSNGDEVVSNSGDRVVVRRDGDYVVLKDDDALLRQPGSTVRTEQFSDGSTREIVTRENGTRIVTIRSAEGRVLQRIRVLPDGTEVLLLDDTRRYDEVDVATLPQVGTPTAPLDGTGEDALRRALQAELSSDLNRGFSLNQIRQIREVRELAPEIEVEAITFESGSAAIRPDQARQLADLGRAIRSQIDARPNEVFLVEGHTDAVGAPEYNLALSDRRAESVALALSEYFDVPPENLVVQGYGEAFLRIDTQEGAQENRRAAVRRITPLLGINLASSN